ncbi:MAG: sigma-54 dependent transcriptional regulator [Nitrospirae bacterium]|nr:sigma-54 dependent transcriptional regulator [Nitrospirota bacterium]
MGSHCMGDILIVDDEPNAVKVLSSILSQEGYDVCGSKDVESATRMMHKGNIDAIITDLRMPGKDGMEFFGYVKENYPHIPVIFLTAYGTVESAVHAIQQGAFYYFIKPPDYVQLKSTVAKAVESRRLKRELEIAKEDHSNENNKYRIIARTPGMLEIFKTIEAVKDSESSVLICGETGTGKELIAKGLHYSSARREKSFIAVNCAAIPKELMESELCGYERGAFTGALSRRIGRFEDASGGTLFLDEIGELGLPLQAKLLRVLQEKEIERLGSNKTIKVDFRLICSTNRDLEKEMQEKHFRDDLFYRINVVSIHVPPLREKKDDIPILVEEFVKEFCVREKKLLTVSDQVMNAFYEYPWPGNIRQLRNIIERAVVLAKGESITLGDLPEEFNPLKERSVEVSRRKTLKEMELQAIKDSLQRCNGNKSKAAKMLGISRKAFYKRLNDELYPMKTD